LLPLLVRFVSRLKLRLTGRLSYLLILIQRKDPVWRWLTMSVLGTYLRVLFCSIHYLHLLTHWNFIKFWPILQHHFRSHRTLILTINRIKNISVLLSFLIILLRVWGCLRFSLLLSLFFCWAFIWIFNTILCWN